MATKNSLSNTKINVTFQSLLHSNGDPLPAEGQEDIYDGSGNKSALKLGRSCNGATVCGPFVCGTLSASNITGTTINATTINATTINGTFSGANLKASTQFNLIDLCNVIYPVGTILITIANNNPVNQFTGTAWERVADGRVLLGVGAHTDLRGNSLNYSYPGNHGGYYHNATSYGVPPHRHVTGGFTGAGEDNWYPYYVGAAGGFCLGSARWVPGDSGRPNWRSDICTTYGTGTGLPFDGGTYNTDQFDVRMPAYAVYAWKRTS